MMNKLIYKTLFSACILLLNLESSGQSLSELSFGSDSTFDVVTWNIEWFPKNESITPDSVVQIIKSLDADIIGIQEIDDTTLFRNAIKQLPDYKLLIAEGYFGGLVYVYKTSTVQVDSLYKILDTSPYWNALPRSPLVAEITYEDEKYVLINNHFKCCGDGKHDQGNPADEEARRYEASSLIKKHIDQNFPSTRVIVLGDLNDILTDKPPHNVFQMFMDDSSNYMFADEIIANSASKEWSYPGWPSHLDHVLITNELFDDFSKHGSGIATIKVENHLMGGWSEYDNIISDHRPVGMNLMVRKATAGLKAKEDFSFQVFPNPTDGHLSINFETAVVNRSIHVVDVYGHQIISENTASKSHVELDFEGPAGIYFLLIESPNSRSVARLIKK
jgi:endonuclease/exonuclease/phosphatase family metal-dependent hydrolase